MKRLLAGLALAGAGLGAHASSVAQDFLPLPDGTRLYYTLTLPDGDGPFPVLLQYDPYAAGVTSDPSWNEAGYAMLGVNFRGTGCSEGAFDAVDARIWGQDGAEVVRWAAAQPWSSGAVGMFGYSFTGTSQLATAAYAGEALKAIAPGNVFPDFYRDFVYLGGIQNAWVPLWVLAGRGYVVGAATLRQPQEDSRCTPQLITQAPPGAVQTPQLYLNTHADDAAWQHTPDSLLSRIEVPVLGCVNWQDTTIYSRAADIFRRQLPSDSTWLVGSNGAHADCANSRARMLRFFDRYVKGLDNGWEATPKLLLMHEVSNAAGGGVRESLPDAAGAWQSGLAEWSDWNEAVTPLALYLQPDGRMTREEPTGAAPPRRLLPAPVSPNTPADWVGIDRFGNPEPDGGSLRYTTPALDEDIEILGAASADLWLASSGWDADVQVTLVEVRPDGQEMYVQNGWLRWSHRHLDETASTALRPVHTHTRADQQMLTPGEAVPGRIEILPVNHVFRAGSAIRLIIDAPAGWFERTASRLEYSVHADAGHPSRLVLGWRPGHAAGAPLPACGSLLNQPCRANPEPVPDGRLVVATSDARGRAGPIAGGIPGALLGLIAALAGWRRVATERSFQRAGYAGAVDSTHFEQSVHAKMKTWGRTSSWLKARHSSRWAATVTPCTGSNPASCRAD